LPRPVASPSVRLVRAPAVATPGWTTRSSVVAALLAVLAVAVWLLRRRRPG
jgi:hypothetical protein